MNDKDLVFRQLQNLRQIQGILRRIHTEAGTHGVYLVDESGFLIAEAGKINLDRVSLAALVAASFGATAEIAKLVGETNFTQLTQQAVNRNLFICRAGATHIVIAVFGRETNLGLVKLYVEQAVIHLGALLDYRPPQLTKPSHKPVEEAIADKAPRDEGMETDVREKLTEEEADLLKSFRDFVGDETQGGVKSFARDDHDVEEVPEVPEEEAAVSAEQVVEISAERSEEPGSEDIREEEVESEPAEKAEIAEPVTAEVETERSDEERSIDELVALAEIAERAAGFEKPADGGAGEISVAVDEAVEIPDGADAVDVAALKEALSRENSVESGEAVELSLEKALQDVSNRVSPSLAANIEVSPDEIIDIELKPEISRLTGELKSEIKELSEESRRLEEELLKPADGDADADAIATPKETEVVKGGGMADETRAEIQEEQVREQSRKEKAATSFPSWLE